MIYLMEFTVLLFPVINHKGQGVFDRESVRRKKSFP